MVRMQVLRIMYTNLQMTFTTPPGQHPWATDKVENTHHIITAMVCFNAQTYIALIVYRCCVWELVCLEMDECCCLAWIVLELAHDLSIYWTPGEKNNMPEYIVNCRVCIQ
jgi:hypothetical protein